MVSATQTTITQPNCLLHLLSTTGVDEQFNTFLTNEDRKALHRVNRLGRVSIEKIDFQKSHRHMMENPSNILVLNPKGKLQLSTHKKFLEEGGFWNRVRYYSGYHNLEIHRAIAKRENELNQKIKVLRAECQEMQKLEYVNLDEVTIRYRQILKLESMSKNLQECLGLQDAALERATGKRFCLLGIVLAITQFIVSCFASRIEFSCDDEEKTKRSVLDGREIKYPCNFPQFINGKKRICTESTHGIGYPIGQTSLDETTGKDAEAIYVYAEHRFKEKSIKKEQRGYKWESTKSEVFELNGSRITLTNLKQGKDSLVSFSVTRPNNKQIVLSYFQFYTRDRSATGFPEVTSFNLKLWEKIKDMAAEILLREDAAHLIIEPNIWMVDRSGRGSLVMPLQLNNLPICFSKMKKREADGTERRELIIRDGIFGDFTKSVETQGLEERIAKNSILKGKGPVVPALPLKYSVLANYIRYF